MMMRCPVCNKYYGDSAEMCPDCEIYLIETEAYFPPSRTRRKVIRAESPANASTSGMPYSPPAGNPVFQRGRDINPPHPATPAGPQYVRPAHNTSLAVFAAILRRYFPVLLLIGAIAALLFRYNVLGINFELAEIIYATMPVAIMIAAIHFMIRSIL